MLEHGGRLQQAAQTYHIPVSEWLDLSTGINPNGWPVSKVPAECWMRLPEEDDGLEQAAAQYYGNTALLPVAGSQAAIQALPALRPACRVTLLSPTYAEHVENWRSAGHKVRQVQCQQIEEALAQTEVLVLVNPNNPSGASFSRQQLLRWHRQLQARGGWLVVDEAFIDCQPGQSLAAEPVRDGLIILRSLGKFFGLAGIRCGFIIAEDRLRHRLQEMLGPWPVSHPGRYVATQALQDISWQTMTRNALVQQSERLKQLLDGFGLAPAGGTALFHWVETEQAEAIYQHFARQGILIRLFQQPCSLRLGLPARESEWLRLEIVLAGLPRLYTMR